MRAAGEWVSYVSVWETEWDKAETDAACVANIYYNFIKPPPPKIHSLVNLLILPLCLEYCGFITVFP